jgi:hypothetical protein
MHPATDYVAFKGEVKIRKAFWPKVVDSLLAGAGLMLGVTSLGWIDALTSLEFFAPPMLASGIIFFAGPAPPSPKSFLLGSVCAASLCVLCLKCSCRC